MKNIEISKYRNFTKNFDVYVLKQIVKNKITNNLAFLQRNDHILLQLNKF